MHNIGNFKSRTLKETDVASIKKYLTISDWNQIRENVTKTRQK